jgi:hypothetical protein
MGLLIGKSADRARIDLVARKNMIEDYIMKNRRNLLALAGILTIAVSLSSAVGGLSDK